MRERFAAPDDATPGEKLIAEKRITKEMTDVVNYYQQVRTRERAVYALQQQRLEAGTEFDDADSVPPPAPLQQSSDAQDQSLSDEALSRGYGPSGYAGQRWHEGGIGVEIAWWPTRAVRKSASFG